MLLFVIVLSALVLGGLAGLGLLLALTGPSSEEASDVQRPPLLERSPDARAVQSPAKLSAPPITKAIVVTPPPRQVSAAPVHPARYTPQPDSCADVLFFLLLVGLLAGSSRPSPKSGEKGTKYSG